MICLKCGNECEKKITKYVIREGLSLKEYNRVRREGGYFLCENCFGSSAYLRIGKKLFEYSDKSRSWIRKKYSKEKVIFT